MDIANGHDLQVLPVIGQAHRAPLLAPLAHGLVDTPTDPEDLAPVATRRGRNRRDRGHGMAPPVQAVRSGGRSATPSSRVDREPTGVPGTRRIRASRSRTADHRLILPHRPTRANDTSRPARARRPEDSPPRHRAHHVRAGAARAGRRVRIAARSCPCDPAGPDRPGRRRASGPRAKYELTPVVCPGCLPELTPVVCRTGCLRAKYGLTPVVFLWTDTGCLPPVVFRLS